MKEGRKERERQRKEEGKQGLVKSRLLELHGVEVGQVGRSGKSRRGVQDAPQHLGYHSSVPAYCRASLTGSRIRRMALQVALDPAGKPTLGGEGQQLSRQSHVRHCLGTSCPSLVTAQGHIPLSYTKTIIFRCSHSGD